MTPSQRVTFVHGELLKSVLNAEGFGGPVAHDAEVEGWKLSFRDSDMGDSTATMANGTTGEVNGFEHIGDEWVPLTVDATPEDLALFADLAERAVWHDTIQRDLGSRDRAD